GRRALDCGRRAGRLGERPRFAGGAGVVGGAAGGRRGGDRGAFVVAGVRTGRFCGRPAVRGGGRPLTGGKGLGRRHGRLLVRAGDVDDRDIVEHLRRDEDDEDGDRDADQGDPGKGSDEISVSLLDHFYLKHGT